MWNGLEALREHLFSGGVFIIAITNHDVRALATESRLDALETTVFTCHAYTLSFAVRLFPDVFMRDGQMSRDRSTEHNFVAYFVVRQKTLTGHASHICICTLIHVCYPNYIKSKTNK